MSKEARTRLIRRCRAKFGREAAALRAELSDAREEAAARMTNPAYAKLIFQTMDAVDAVKQNIQRVSPTFRFHLITTDPDDDKFADCAIAAEADDIVTADSDFKAMRGSGNKPQPITPEEFIRLHLSGGVMMRGRESKTGRSRWHRSCLAQPPANSSQASGLNALGRSLFEVAWV
jgi:predicted nucleic acid-binding protein